MSTQQPRRSQRILNKDITRQDSAMETISAPVVEATVVEDASNLAPSSIVPASERTNVRSDVSGSLRRKIQLETAMK